MDGRVGSELRVIRVVQNPLAQFIRVARGDARCVQDFLEARGAHFHGLVIDPTRVAIDKELRDTATNRRIDLVLDPRTQESSVAGAYNAKLGKLPWGAGRPHEPRDFEGHAGRRRALAIAEFAQEHQFTKVLSHTHLIRTLDDEWFEIDQESVHHLREALDGIGLENVPIAYSLAIPYALLRDAEDMELIADRLQKSGADEIWLKVDGLGSDSTSAGVRNYVEAARLLHAIGKPLVADHVGGLVGLSLLAFGGVGGLSHGVTLRERFSTSHWFRERPEGSQFGLHHRVYLPMLDLYLKGADARALLDNAPALRARIACHDHDCCPRGVVDMVERPGRHFLNQRAKQFGRLSEVPSRLRTSVFMEEFLRRASDHAMAVSNMRVSDAEFVKKMKKQRLRLDALRETLGAFAERKPPQSFASLPQTRIVRESRRSDFDSRRPNA